MPIALGAVAFGLRTWQPGPVTETTDEPLWLKRADGFRYALEQGDLAHATAAHQVPTIKDGTMPGVTTMWAINIGRGLAKVGAELGLSTPVVGSSADSATVLRLGRGVVALWCSISIGLVVVLGWSLVGRGAATVAGVLLATEPWFVGLSDLAHTDALVTVFSALSILTLAWALQRDKRRTGRHERPQTPTRPAAWTLVASGTAGALALLTKVNAAAMVLPGVAIVTLAMSRRKIRFHGLSMTFEPGLLKQWLRLALWWTGSAIVTFVALWPAMWTAPLRQIGFMFDTLKQIGTGNVQFFLGAVTADPGPAYYPVALAFRVTPWFLIGVAAVLVTVALRAIRRVTRGPVPPSWIDHLPLWLLVACVPYLAAITWSSKKYDRYVLPLIPFLALAIGVVAAGLVGVIVRRVRTDRFVWPLAAVATVVVAALTVAQAPYALSYVNPLLGGQEEGRQTILLGWDEGIEEMGATIARREAGNCAAITVATYRPLRIALPCGHFHDMPSDGDLAGINYVVTYINMRQRHIDDTLWRSLHQHASLIDQVRVDGVSYAQLWKVPPAASGHPAGG